MHFCGDDVENRDEKELRGAVGRPLELLCPTGKEGDEEDIMCRFRSKQTQQANE